MALGPAGVCAAGCGSTSSTAAASGAAGIRAVYQAIPDPQPVTPAAMARAANEIRAITSDLPGLASVAVSGRRLTLIVPRQAADLLSIVSLASRPLRFYDWESHVIGPRGRPEPANPDVAGGESAGMPSSGVPAYTAVLRASVRPVALRSERSTGPSGTWYEVLDSRRQVLFPSRGPGYETRAGLIAAVRASGNRPAQGARVVNIPPGTIVVRTTDERGGLAGTTSSDRYIVLNDAPALSGADLTDPLASTDPVTGAPSVQFGFTHAGADAFARLTRAVARRGARISSSGAPSFQHFAIALGDQLVTVPYIDFNQYPHGIDPGYGSEISGGLTASTAFALAQLLQRGPLPVRLEFVSPSPAR